MKHKCSMLVSERHFHLEKQTSLWKTEKNAFFHQKTINPRRHNTELQSQRMVTVVEGHLSFAQKADKNVFQTLSLSPIQPLSPKNCASLPLNQSFEEDHFKNV